MYALDATFRLHCAARKVTIRLSSVIIVRSEVTKITDYLVLESSLVTVSDRPLDSVCLVNNEFYLSLIYLALLPDLCDKNLFLHSDLKSVLSLIRSRG